MKRFISLVWLILASLLVIIYSNFFLPSNKNQENYKKEKIIGEEKKEKNITRANIMATGDIMFHLPLYIKTKNAEGKYDFSTYYEKVKEYLTSSDYAIGNFEATINPNRPIAGHPMFNAPKEAVKFLKDFGFDALSTCNNHCLDTGYEGVLTTIDAIKENNILPFGTRKEENDRINVVDIKGIKVGLLSYSEMFNGMEGILKDKSYVVSPLDLNMVKKDIEDTKKAGADIILVYCHWGDEYHTDFAERQRLYANEIFKAGADIILGSHPHVLQKALKFNVDGRDKFLIYSMGNSIANQRKEWMGTYDTECGVIVSINLKKENEKINFDVDLIPTYTHRRIVDGIYRYYVYAMKDLLEGGKYREDLPESEKIRLDNNYKRSMEILDYKK